MRTIAEYFFIFMLYSVCGWITETLIYALFQHKIVKRGFLFGPVCPIYGTGAVICSLLLYGKVHNVFLLFLLGVLICGSLEYLTHFILEKLFDAMWWDYSSRRFNIKGRVYLNGLIQFGAGVVIIIRVLQPLVYKMLDYISTNVLFIICFVVYSILIIDLTATVIDLKNIIATIKFVQEFAIKKSQSEIDHIGEIIRNNEYLNTSINLIKDNKFVKRVAAKYPNFKSSKYAAVIDLIRNKPDENKQRKDIKIYGSTSVVNDKNDEEQTVSYNKQKPR